MERLMELRPRHLTVEPEDAFRAWCFRLTKHKSFETAILVVILANTLLLAADSYGASDRFAAVLDSLNQLCTLAFLLEACVRIAALGWHKYWAEPWHRFDLTVVVFAIIDWLASLFFGNYGEKQPTVIRVLRLARVLRMMRMIRVMRGLSMLLSMVMVSVAGLFNVIVLYLIVLTIYAMLAMQLFGSAPYGEFLTLHANFCTFPNAMLMLFRCATGEDWNGIMRDTMQASSGVLSVPFFVSFEVIARFLVLNMVIALVNESYAAALKRDEQSLSAESTEAYVDAWSKYDPDATGRMHVRHLRSLIMDLKPPLGLDPRVHGTLGAITSADAARYIFQMNLHSHRGRSAEDEVHVTFTELLACLVKDMDLEGDASESQRGAQMVGELRKSRPWHEVLPSPDTPVGRRWFESDMLSSYQLVSTEEARRQAMRASSPEDPLPESFGRSASDDPSTRESSGGGATDSLTFLGADTAKSALLRQWRQRQIKRREAKQLIEYGRKQLAVQFKDAVCQTEAQTETEALSRTVPPLVPETPLAMRTRAAAATESTSVATTTGTGGEDLTVPGTRVSQSPAIGVGDAEDWTSRWLARSPKVRPGRHGTTVAASATPGVRRSNEAKVATSGSQT
jgi:hypothetical protein